MSLSQFRYELMRASVQLASDAFGSENVRQTLPHVHKIITHRILAACRVKKWRYFTSQQIPTAVRELNHLRDVS